MIISDNISIVYDNILIELIIIYNDKTRIYEIREIKSES